MKNILLLAALLSATITLQAQSVNDENDMQDFARKFMNAYNQRDAEAIRGMYLDDAVRIDAEGREIKGADNIAAYFADQFVKNNATVFVRQLSISWSDQEHALVAHGAYEVNGKTNVYDIPVHFTRAYANAMIKEDGQWKIAKSMHFPVKHADPTVAANVKMYTETWDRIINEGRFELFNEDHFTSDIIGDTLRYDVGEPVFDIVISSDTILYWKSLNPKYGTEAHEKIVVIPISEHENMVSYVENDGKGPGVCWYNDFARGITTVSVFFGGKHDDFFGYGEKET